MYSNFYQAVRALASQDKKGLWSRWLAFRETLSLDDLDHLMDQEADQMYSVFVLAMLIAPDPNSLAEHVGWKAIRIDYEDERYSRVEEANFVWFAHPKTAKEIEDLMISLLDDLASRQTLTLEELRAWQVCEGLIFLLLGNKKMDDSRAIRLLRYLRFYCVTDLTGLDPSTTFSNTVCLLDEYEDKRWTDFMWSCMERLVELEIEGCGTFRPPEFTSCGMQYVFCLYVQAESIGFDGVSFFERIKFVAEHQLLTEYHNKFGGFSPLFLSRFVEHSEEVLYLLALNFLAINPEKADTEHDEFNLEQIEKVVLPAVKRYGDDGMVRSLKRHLRVIRARVRTESMKARALEDLIEEMKNPG